MAETENKVTFGLDNVHVAFRKAAGANGEPTWEKPERVIGAVELSMDAEGDQTKKYGDNSIIYTANSNNGYTGTLTMTNIPNAVLARMLGWKIDKNGALVEVADGIPGTFALLYDVSGDAHKRHGVTYDVTASRPSIDHKTNEDSPEFSDLALSITAVPIELGGDKVVKSQLGLGTDNADAYGKFFEAVYVPEYDENGVVVDGE